MPRLFSPFNSLGSLGTTLLAAGGHIHHAIRTMVAIAFCTPIDRCWRVDHCQDCNDALTAAMNCTLENPCHVVGCKDCAPKNRRYYIAPNVIARNTPRCCVQTIRQACKDQVKPGYVGTCSCLQRFRLDGDTWYLYVGVE